MRPPGCGGTWTAVPRLGRGRGQAGGPSGPASVAATGGIRRSGSSLRRLDDVHRHRLRRRAWHPAPRRSQRGHLYFYHGLPSPWGGPPTMRNWPRSWRVAGRVLACAVALAAYKKEKVREEVAVIDTNLGRIVFRFYEQDSPKTIAAFKSMVRAGIYDGTQFHRVLPGLSLEGGDPEMREAGPAPAGAVVSLEIEKSELKH